MVPIWKETEKNNSDLVTKLEQIETKVYKKNTAQRYNQVW